MNPYQVDACKSCRVEIVTHPDDDGREPLVRASREVYSRTKKDLFTFRVIACKSHARYFFRDAVPTEEL